MKLDASQQIPFFVYGTLIPGQPNDHLWLDKIRSVETAYFTNGKLYDMGYYPMLVEQGNGTVKGKLVYVAADFYQEVMNDLDNLEGFDPDRPANSSFIRKRREVTIENGQKIQCWLYVGRQEYVYKSEEIQAGDWLAYVAHLPGNLQDWWKSVDTVWGLHNRVEDVGK